MYPTDFEGNLQGASMVLAPDKARLSGEYFKLPKETILSDRNIVYTGMSFLEWMQHLYECYCDPVSIKIQWDINDI